MIGPHATAHAFRMALEARLRNTHPFPAHLPGPPPAWAEPYAALAQELGLPALTLQKAQAYLDTYWYKWGLGQMNVSAS